MPATACRSRCRSSAAGADPPAPGRASGKARSRNLHARRRPAPREIHPVPASPRSCRAGFRHRRSRESSAWLVTPDCIRYPGTDTRGLTRYPGTDETAMDFRRLLPEIRWQSRLSPDSAGCLTVLGAQRTGSMSRGAHFGAPPPQRLSTPVPGPPAGFALQYEDAVSQSGHARATAPGFRHGGDGGRSALRRMPCRRGHPRPQRRVPPSRRSARPGPDPRWPRGLPLPPLGIRLRHRRIRLRPHQTHTHFRSQSGRRRHLYTGSLVPELPEVETVVRSLAPIAGQRILGAEFRNLRILRGGDPAVLSARLEGRRILAVQRYGKFIVAPIGGGGYLTVHLGMTGRLLLGADPGKHTHAIFPFDRATLLFDDSRQFGSIEFSEGFPRRVARLGPEPLEIPFDEFAAALRRHKTRIKSLLLNQTFVRGVGNIYADEALFRAGIHPQALTRRIRRDRARKLYDAIAAVLTEAIAAGGSSISDYVDAEGRRGFFQISPRVYQRTGEPCPTCRTPIRRVIVTQRSRSEEHTSELQSLRHLVCRLLLEKKT